MKKIKSYTGIWNVEKVLYAINDFTLPFPVTFTQITWFVITEFAVILLGDLPPLSFIEGAFLKYFGIPVALDFIHSDRSIFKIVDLDEAWAFLNVAQGETLSNKLVRAGRAMQAGVYFVTQSSGDVSKESLKNNIGLKFAFSSTDINEIKQTLEFFGIDKDDENNQKRLRDLENGQCLLQDLYGRVGVVQIHPVFEELLHAFDTRPPVKSEVE